MLFMFHWDSNLKWVYLFPLCIAYRTKKYRTVINETKLKFKKTGKKLLRIPIRLFHTFIRYNVRNINEISLKHNRNIEIKRK